MNEMYVSVGTSISRVAEDAVKRAPVWFKFNDLRIEVPVGMTADAVESTYFRLSDERRAAYVNSPAGREAARKAEEKIQQVNHQLLQATDQLDTLDFSDIKNPLKFLNDIQDATDHVGTDQTIKSNFTEKTLKVFASNGFTPSMELGRPEEDYENKIISARYIIGQGLATLKFLAIHQIYCSFYDTWVGKFG